MRQADLTVAIATMGRPSALARCLRAVLDGATLPAELVIIDQSTDDATERVVRRMASSSAVRVDYVRQPRLGLAASRNAAIAASTRPIVAFTDDDCVPDSYWLTAIISTFETDPNTDVVTGRILPLGPDQPGRHAVSCRRSCMPARFHGRSLPWTAGSGGNVAVKRSWLERVGGFDERLGAGARGLSAEDMDLLYRLLCAGAVVQYEPASIVLHERKDDAGWLATGRSYGFGMAAFCGLWLRKRELYAGWILARWCADQAAVLAMACIKRRWQRAAGQLLMLKTAAPGLLYGWRCAGSEARRFREAALTECHR
jgi:GT2 family glycosyltransferase